MPNSATIKRSRKESHFHLAHREVLARGREMHRTMLEILEKEKALREQYNVPDRAWTYARGYRDAMFVVWSAEQAFCYEIDGKLVKARSEEIKPFYVRIHEEKIEGKIYWLKDGVPEKLWY